LSYHLHHLKEPHFPMANLTMRFGALLIILGFATWFVTIPHAPTSLIPAIFGILLVLFGSLARTPDSKKRMLWMHIAVTVGLLGFIFPFVRALKPFINMLRGITVAHPRAVIEEMLMALICLIFTVLCIRSFIAARRARIQ